MDIQKINSAVEQIGYNPFGISGNNQDADAQALAEKNGISIDEAKTILKTAEEKAQENDKIQAAQASFIMDIINDQDEEEEIELIDDFDFDNFLKQESGEEQMQNLLNKQQFLNSNAFGRSQQDSNSAENNNLFSNNNFMNNDNNPFLKKQI